MVSQWGQNDKIRFCNSAVCPNLTHIQRKQFALFSLANSPFGFCKLNKFHSSLVSRSAVILHIQLI